MSTQTPKGTLLLVINHQNEVLLQHKDANAPLHANQWCLFGGGIEAGESAEDAIKREFKEELEWPIKKVTHLKQYPGNDVFFAKTTKSADELHKHLHEGNDVRYFSHQDLESIDIAEPHRKIIADFFAQQPKKALFICRGNAFRSIIAEACLNSLQIPGVNVQSRGTVAGENPEANNRRFAEVQKLLDRHNLLPFAKKTHAEQLTQRDIDQSDIVVCVNDRVFDNCPVSFNLPANAQTWDIADIGDPGHIAHNQHEITDIEAKTFIEIKKRVKQLSDQLLRQPTN